MLQKKSPATARRWLAFPLVLLNLATKERRLSRQIVWFIREPLEIDKS